MASFAQHLYNTMIEKDMNQAMLSDASGISRDEISRLMASRRFPTNDELAKLAQALNVSRDYLMGNPRAAD